MRHFPKHLPYLLVCLSEECAEISKEASKAYRFGPNDNYLESSPEERLALELDDLKAVIELLQESGLKLNSDRTRIDAKKKKVQSFLNKLYDSYKTDASTTTLNINLKS
jgi:hypothetical protein